jgi:hypothetical protein
MHLEPKPTQLKGRILYENEQWWVAEDGLESKPTPFDNGGFVISSDRLVEEHRNWIDHTIDKAWCDPELFANAYYVACNLVLHKPFERTEVRFVPDLLATRLLDEQTQTLGWRRRTLDTSEDALDRLVQSDSLDCSLDEYVYARLTVAKEHTTGWLE